MSSWQVNALVPTAPSPAPKKQLQRLLDSMLSGHPMSFPRLSGSVMPSSSGYGVVASMPHDLTPDEARMLAERLDVLTSIAVDEARPLAERAQAMVERLNLLAEMIEEEVARG